MIRTHIVPCHLKREQADALNLASGRIYSAIVSRHWRLLKKKGLWLSDKGMRKLSDLRWSDRNLPMHAHTIDAAQEGFPKACATTRALRKAGFEEANFPWRNKKFRTTVWKNTAIKLADGTGTLRVRLSNGQGNQRVEIVLPVHLADILKACPARIMEVRLVFDKRARKYNWHVVVENGKQPKAAPGDNIVSVDPGEIHPAVVGDENESTIITCRARRHEAQGHAKRLASINQAISRKRKGSRRYRKLVRAKSRLKARHELVTRDMAHKVSREIVNVAIERKVSTIVMGDIRDIADGVDHGKQNNQQISGWNHGQIRAFVEYKAEAEGIAVVLQNEAYTSKTCPSCGHRHKPRGRNFRCPACRFQSHRDIVGQINILSAHKFGAPGKIPVPTVVKHRIPHNLRVMRRRQDTALEAIPVARGVLPREAAGL